jgi:peptidoglycan/LPS O-acetylase OafA/YrhL
MWTLAVEEQFYVVWPLAMLVAVAVVRRFKLSLDNTLAGLLLAGSVVSLVGCLLITTIRPTAAFYLTPSRLKLMTVAGPRSKTTNRSVVPQRSMKEARHCGRRSFWSHWV